MDYRFSDNSLIYASTGLGAKAGGLTYVTGADYHGNHVPFVPDFNAITALQYKEAQGYFARAEIVWKGKTYFDESQTAAMSQSDYTLLNLRVGYEKNGYSGYVYADNITDSYYYTIKQGGRNSPASPRVVGLRLGADF